MAFGTAVAASYKAKAPGPYTSDMERIRQAPTASPVYSGAAIEFGRPSTIANEGSFCHDLSPEKGQPHR
jgi:interleukin-1 receptor-associated kinase 1